MHVSIRVSVCMNVCMCLYVRRVCVRAHACVCASFSLSLSLSQCVCVCVNEQVLAHGLLHFDLKEGTVLNQ